MSVINKFNRPGLNKMFADILKEFRRVEVTLSHRAYGKNRLFLLAHFLFLLDKLELVKTLKSNALRRPPRSWFYVNSAENHMRKMVLKLGEVTDDILQEIRKIWSVFITNFFLWLMFLLRKIFKLSIQLFWKNFNIISDHF